MAKLLKYTKKNNKIISVSFLMNTENEKRIYKSFLDTEMTLNRCERCKEPIDRSVITDYYLIMYNPASNGPLGFPTGTPVVKCPHCGHPIQMSLMDITPFTAITAWRRQLIEHMKKGSKQSGE